MGGLAAADWRNRGQSPEALVRQRLLADLIGGEPRRADQLAARLISAFGSVGGVLAATPAALGRFIEDPGLVSRLSAAKAAVMEGIAEQLRRARFDLSNRAVQLWIISLFKQRPTEGIHFALLGPQKQLLWDEPVGEGDLHSVGLNLRKIVSRGIDVGASAVVLMHNHPSGNPQPSPADVAETRRVGALLKQLDLPLEDHLIVAANTIFSMQSAHLM